MSRRAVKPTVFHDDSRSSDAGSVVAAPARTKPRTNREPPKDLLGSQNDKLASQQNGYANTGVKGPPVGPEGEIQVFSLLPTYFSFVVNDQVDFNAFPIQVLEKYKHHYNLAVPDPPPPKKKIHHSNAKKRSHEDSEEEASNSEDESPYRIDLGAWQPRINKSELAKAARTHFSTLPQARENDTIVHFLYATKMQGMHGRLAVDD